MLGMLVISKNVAVISITSSSDRKNTTNNNDNGNNSALTTTPVQTILSTHNGYSLGFTLPIWPVLSFPSYWGNVSVCVCVCYYVLLCIM